jgi:hypothetical protein
MSADKKSMRAGNREGAMCLKVIFSPHKLHISLSFRKSSAAEGGAVRVAHICGVRGK